jgi:multicomponent Na+:H+ antiporter subunit D
MDTVYSIKPLLAIIAALAGAGLVMLSGRKPNIRESWSFIAAVCMFGIIASMIGTVAPAPLGDGKTIVCQLFQILPGVSVTLRVDAFSMIFAIVASFLWILAVFYSAGYMRGLHEHAQRVASEAGVEPEPKRPRKARPPRRPRRL